MRYPLLSIERFSGPSSALTPYVLADDPLLYRLLSVSVQLTIGSGPLLPVLAVSDVVDGVTIPRAKFFPIWPGAVAASAASLFCTFAVGMANQVSIVDSAWPIIGGPTGENLIQAPIPPDLWIPPQSVVTLSISGATAPGSGGDTWNWISVVKERIVTSN